MIAEPWNFVGLGVAIAVALVPSVALVVLARLARRAPHKRALLPADPVAGELPPASEAAPPLS